LPIRHTYMIVWHSSVSLSVSLSQINIWISPQPMKGFSQKFVHIYYRKKYAPKKILVILGWINPEFDFFIIPLSPLKMQKNLFFWLQVLLDILRASWAKKLEFNVLGSSGGHNPKIQGQIYLSMLFSQEPIIEISKNFFLRKSVVKKTILS